MRIPRRALTNGRSKCTHLLSPRQRACTMSSAWMRHVFKLKVRPVKGSPDSKGRLRGGASAVAQKAVLTAIAWHHHPDMVTVEIGTRKIAECTGLGRQAVMQTVDALVATGALIRHPSAGGRGVYSIDTTDRTGVENVPPHKRAPDVQRTGPVRGTYRCGEQTGVENVPPPGVENIPEVVCSPHHVEYGVSTRDLPPTPRRGDGPHSQAEPEGMAEDAPTATDRFEAREAAAIEAAQKLAGHKHGDPVTLPPLPSKTGNNATDILNIAVWYHNGKKTHRAMSDDELNDCRRLMTTKGIVEFIDAVQGMAADGIRGPSIRNIRARIGTDRMRRIDAEREKRAESQAKQWPVQKLKVLA